MPRSAQSALPGRRAHGDYADWAGQPLRVVAIGGGSGLSALLKGLKHYSPQLGDAMLHPPVDITAVVTVTDDGGSSGRLRRDLDILPPGDIRNCMVALSEDESLMARLFAYRFSAGRGLKGHSFGNLFLAGLTQITGDFAKAVQLSSEVLAIAGHIYPATQANVTLRAHLAGGRIVDGETRISRSDAPFERIELRPAGVRPLRATLDAIGRADLITLGPGSLFTSVVPNLLVSGIASAIRRSPALKVCFVNLMWQPGETTGMNAADHIAALHRHARGRIVDCAVVNTTPIEVNRLVRYARQRAMQVANNLDDVRALGVDVVALPLLAAGTKVRHDPERIARATIELAKKGRRRILDRLAAEQKAQK